MYKPELTKFDDVEASRGLDLFSIFARDARGLKYSEKMLKGLDQVLQRIAMGQDPKSVSPTGD